MCFSALFWVDFVPLVVSMCLLLSSFKIKIKAYESSLKSQFDHEFRMSDRISSVFRTMQLVPVKLVWNYTENRTTATLVAISNHQPSNEGKGNQCGELNVPWEMEPITWISGRSCVVTTPNLTYIFLGRPFQATANRNLRNSREVDSLANLIPFPCRMKSDGPLLRGC